MKNGFTLIELTLVILILLIILIVVSPKVLRSMENSKKEAFLSGTKTLMTAIEKTSLDLTWKNENKDIVVMYENSIRTIYPSNASIEYSGANPRSGVIIFGKSGNAVLSLYNGKYCAFKINDNEKIKLEETTESECNEKLVYKQNTEPFNNIVTNGNFSNGTVGWISENSNISSSNNTLTNINTASDYGIVRNNTSIPTGRKVYARARVRVTNSSASNIILRITGTTEADSNTTTLATPSINQWYTISGIRSVPSALGNIRVSIRQGYIDAATALGKVLEVQEVVSLDLTALGLESLTIAELDELTSTSNWFNSIDSAITPKVKTVGNNLIDMSKIFNPRVDTTAEWNDTSLTVNGNWYSSVPLTLVKNTQYYFNYESQGDGTPTVAIYSTSDGINVGNQIGTYTSPSVFNSGNYENVLALFYTNTGGLLKHAIFSEIQIEQGTSSTSYVPYTENYRFEGNLFNRLWFDTTTNTPKKFSAGSWIGL